MPSIMPKRRCKHFANLYVVDSSGVPYSEKSMLLASFHSVHLSFMCCMTSSAKGVPSASVWLWPVMYFTHSYRPAYPSEMVE